jgi:hypothetical protein
MTILQNVTDSFNDRLRPYEFRESSKAKTVERSKGQNPQTDVQGIVWQF